MKIQTNFVRSPLRTARRLAVCLLLLCAGLLVAIWWLLQDGSRLRERQVVLLAQLASGAPSMPTPSLPPDQALSQTRDRVAAVNAQVRTRGLSTLTLLAELENMLPARVWLASLHHRATEGEVQVLVLATQADLLYGLLQELERHPHVAQATLVRATRPNQRTSDGLVQFEIRLKVRT